MCMLELSLWNLMGDIANFDIFVAMISPAYDYFLCSINAPNFIDQEEFEL